MTKLFIVVPLLLGLLGCAKPNYQDYDPTENSPQNTCALFLKKSQLCLDIVWHEKPRTDKENIFTLHLYNKQNPADPISIKNAPHIFLWMPSMGHGSAPVKKEKIAEDRYEVSNVYFIMPGEWEIHIQLNEDTEDQDEAIYTLTL